MHRLYKVESATLLSRILQFDRESSRFSHEKLKRPRHITFSKALTYLRMSRYFSCNKVEPDI